MKREGPCWHCGIAYTPLWRSGPTEKPVLCNACGSRWRIRGTLADYVPKHATKDNQATKPSNGAEATKPYFSFGCFEDETTNRSGSSSTASSDTCIRTENINGLDEFKIWDKESIPRRKRSVLSQWVLSPVERLHKDLLQLMYQQQVFAQPEAEDELIYENTNFFSSPPETAYGAMLLQSPNPETKENKREDLGKVNETKLESPMSPLTEKETESKSPISLEQFSSKSIPPTNQVAQKYECPPYVRKRGRPRKGTKHSAGHKCTSTRVC